MRDGDDAVRPAVHLRAGARPDEGGRISTADQRQEAAIRRHAAPAVVRVADERREGAERARRPPRNAGLHDRAGTDGTGESADRPGDGNGGRSLVQMSERYAAIYLLRSG